jgi:hypothetical protein
MNSMANLTSDIVTMLEQHCDEVTSTDSNTTPTSVERSTDSMVCELLQQSCSNTSTTTAEDDMTYPFMLLQRHCEYVPEDLNEQFASPYLLMLVSCMALLLVEYMLAKSDFKKLVLQAVAIPKLDILTQALRAAYDKKVQAGTAALDKLGINQREFEQMSAPPPIPLLPSSRG